MWKIDEPEIFTALLLELGPPAQSEPFPIYSTQIGEYYNRVKDALDKYYIASLPLVVRETAVAVKIDRYIDWLDRPDK